MSTITTRSGKGSPLTNNEVDANFTNLNTDKLESSDLSVTTTAVGTAALAYNSGVFTYTPPDLSAIDLSLYAPLAGAVFTGTVEAPLFEGDLSGAQLFPAKAGEALTKGDALYISGISGNKPVVMKADANDPAKMPSFGLAGATVSTNASVNCITYGQIHNLDTTAFSLGDQLYVSTTAGALTSTAPTGETSQIQNLAKVERVHASAGALFVAGSGRANATPNLDNGNFFLGNSSNQSASATFSTSVTGIALPLSGGAMAGAITTNSTFDGRDVATDGTKLDGIEANADVTDATNVTAAGALMDGELTAIASVKALNQGVATTDSPTFSNLTLSGTDSVKVPSGTTGQRNGSPTNGMFRYNSTTAEFEGYQDGAWGSIGGGTSDITLSQFTGDGSDTTFTLSGLAAENNTFVFIDGVYQSKSNYSVSTADPAVVTFSTAPPNTTAIEVMVAAISVSNIGTPSDNTVSTAKIVDGAVTTAKIADDAVTAAKLTSGDYDFDSITVRGAITEDAVTLTGTTTTIDLATATNFVHDLTGATTYTFSNPASTGNATAFTLKIIQDSTARTITWPASVDWAGGTAPTLTSTNNGVDVFVFYTIDGGTTYYGFTAGQAMA